MPIYNPPYQPSFTFDPAVKVSFAITTKIPASTSVSKKLFDAGVLRLGFFIFNNTATGIYFGVDDETNSSKYWFRLETNGYADYTNLAYLGELWFRPDGNPGDREIFLTEFFPASNT